MSLTLAVISICRDSFIAKKFQGLYRDIEKDKNSTMSHKTERLPIIVSIVNPRLLCGGGGKKQGNPDWGSLSKETFFRREEHHPWKTAMVASLKLRNMPENSGHVQHKVQESLRLGKTHPVSYWAFHQNAALTKELQSNDWLGPARVESLNGTTPALNYLKALEALINGLNMAGECDLPIQELSVRKSYPIENPQGPQQVPDIVLNKLMISGNKYYNRW